LPCLTSWRSSRLHRRPAFRSRKSVGCSRPRGSPTLTGACSRRRPTRSIERSSACRRSARAFAMPPPVLLPATWSAPRSSGFFKLPVARRKWSGPRGFLCGGV
ncbi:MAG: Transcriptional regulator, MerR family, partial [uncultured Ramlibacter sp.]